MSSLAKFVFFSDKDVFPVIVSFSHHTNEGLILVFGSFLIGIVLKLFSLSDSESISQIQIFYLLISNQL